MHLFDTPLAVDEFAGEPIEQFRLAGAAAGVTEIAERLHNPSAEMEFPDAVDHHPRGQRVAPVDDGRREFHPTAPLGVTWRLVPCDDVQEPPRHDLAGLADVATNRNRHIFRTGFGQEVRLRQRSGLLLLGLGGVLPEGRQARLPGRPELEHVGPVEVGAEVIAEVSGDADVRRWILGFGRLLPGRHRLPVCVVCRVPRGEDRVDVRLNPPYPGRAHIHLIRLFTGEELVGRRLIQQVQFIAGSRKDLYIVPITVAPQQR